MPRWIIIADAAEARCFSLDDATRSLHLVENLKHPISRARNQNIDSDQPGRLRKGKGSQTRSAMEPRTDSHTVQVQQFAREIGDVLKLAFDRHAFDRFAIVAPPRFLGLLRKQLDPGVAACLEAHIARNCTHVAIHDVADLLRDELVGWFGGTRQPSAETTQAVRRSARRLAVRRLHATRK